MAIGLVAGILSGVAVGFATDPCNDASYRRALEQATQAVAIGKQAPNLNQTEALIQWQQADLLWESALTHLARVRDCSDNRDGAQQRLESYARNRQLVQQEIAKLQAAE